MPLFPKKPLWVMSSIVIFAVVAIGLGLFFYGEQDNVVSDNKVSQKNQENKLSKTTQSKPNVPQVKAGGGNLPVSKQPPLPLPKTDRDEEGQAYFDNLHNQSPEIVWEQWKWLLELKTDGDELDLTATALAQILQKTPSDQVYTDMRDMLNDPSVLLERRASLVALLSETATPASLDIILAAVLDDHTDPSVRPALLNGIDQVGDNLWDGRFHTELSPALEDAWKDLPYDQEARDYIARTIAGIGAPSGVDLLMTDVQRSPGTFDAIRTVRNPEALPVLIRWYESGRITDSHIKDVVGRVISVTKNMSTPQ